MEFLLISLATPQGEKNTSSDLLRDFSKLASGEIWTDQKLHLFECRVSCQVAMVFLETFGGQIFRDCFTPTTKQVPGYVWKKQQSNRTSAFWIKTVPIQQLKENSTGNPLYSIKEYTFSSARFSVGYISVPEACSAIGRC